jgi:monoamine oxidase
MTRRDVLAAAGSVLGTSALHGQVSGRQKSVVVIGAGIAGLSCAYELVRRGHNVTVLEAAGRAGGHVRTLHDPFADGLYADLGAEHFYYPGYTEYWRYLKEFSLTAIPYPRRDNMVRFLNGERFTEEDLHTRAILGKLGFSQKEVNFLAGRPWAELPLLYLERHVDAVRDEMNPFEKGLAELDQLSLAGILKREGASATALQFFGGSGSSLQTIWGAAIKKLRRTDSNRKSCSGSRVGTS